MITHWINKALEDQFRESITYALNERVNWSHHPEWRDFHSNYMEMATDALFLLGETL